MLRYRKYAAENGTVEEVTTIRPIIRHQSQSRKPDVVDSANESGRSASKPLHGKLLADPAYRRLYDYARKNPTIPKLHRIHLHIPCSPYHHTIIPSYISPDTGSLIDLETSVQTVALENPRAIPAGIDLDVSLAPHIALNCKSDAARAVSDMSIQTRCLQCEGRPCRFKCPDCETTTYCSEHCVAINAPVHKRHCGVIEAMDAKGRPSPSHFRTIHFPLDGSGPKFIWVKGQLNRPQHRISYYIEEEDIVSFVEDLDWDMDMWFVLVSGMTHLFQKPLGHGLVVAGSAPRRPHVPSDINHSVARLGKPGHLAHMCGLATIFAYTVSPDGFITGLDDAGHRDMHMAIELHTDNHYNPVLTTNIPGVPTVPAIKFNRLDDPWISAWGIKEAVESVRMPQGNRPGMYPYPLAHPFAIGLRWFVRTVSVPHRVDWSKTAWNPADPLMALFGEILDVEFDPMPCASLQLTHGQGYMEGAPAQRIFAKPPPNPPVFVEDEERNRREAEETHQMMNTGDAPPPQEVADPTKSGLDDTSTSTLSLGDDERLVGTGLLSLDRTPEYKTKPVSYWNSFFLFHAYKQPIHPMHVAALVAYLNLLGKTGAKPTKEGFEGYWDWYKAKEIEKGRGVHHIPSPYSHETRVPRGETADPRVERLVKYYSKDVEPFPFDDGRV